jgi:glycosyltransferase involved in cell wall biosynthesis
MMSEVNDGGDAVGGARSARPTLPRKTVCQLLHSLIVGGAEVLASRLSRQLADRYRFVFACLDGLGSLGEELRSEGFVVEVLNRQSGIDLSCAARLREFWRREKVDVVHAHQYTPFFYAMVARRWRRSPPLLFTEHGRFFPDYPRTKRIVFNRLMLGRSDQVVGVGESVRRALIANEGIPAGRVEVIYNGVDPRAFDSQPIDRAAVRREIGIEPDDLMVIQVARLDHLKDHSTAVRAIQQVAREVPKAQLVLVGEGPELDKIQRAIGQCDVQNHVRLLGLRHDVARLLAAADVFLLTSVSEGIPVTILEAMAAGLPIVSTAVGGVPEIVVPEVTGLLAPSGDDAGLARAICRLAVDRGHACELGHQGRLRAQEKFSQKQMELAYQERYDSLLRS